MRVLQLIDSLEAGGAEQVAVTFANALSNQIEASHLCVSRGEGVLKNKINSKVHYTFLQKRSVLDFKALFVLRNLIKKNKIRVIHAHATSFFFATLIKMSHPKIKIIWHEHYGKRVDTGRSQNYILYFCSFFFSKIITVSEALQSWCKEKLATKEVEYFPNFIDIDQFSDQVFVRSNLIVCVANLKPPKNHINLLKAFNKVHSSFPEWNLQLIGKDFQNDYSDRMKKYILNNELISSVEIYGSSNQVISLISKAKIGVLSSDSEGLPMALLEYGVSGLAVVTTNVGYCEIVVNNFGKTVPPKESNALSNALIDYIENETVRKKDARDFRKHIFDTYSMDVVLPKLINIYKKYSN